MLLLLAPYGWYGPPTVHAALTRYIGNITYPLDEQLSYCDSLGPELYEGVTADLALWNASGISAEALALATAKYTTSGGQKDSSFTLSCPVRAHFMEWAARRHPQRIDVKSGPRVTLSKHAAYKYLLHLDGQALSSRLEQLLPLRSLILKEDSGYKTFYYHLVRPYEHYIPVWKQGGGPEDVMDAVEWAEGHDEEAQRMAAAAQAVAVKYLSKRARSCYWLRLFQAYAALQRFTPSRERRPYAVTLEEYLETVGRSFERGKQLHKIEN
ncbi:KDEL motif-containing protein 1 [Tetrabaena socialis]|uniref:KDEL motif-containing protein 1 n=1 Tax=Tetrabaena socialis TaxID=47790 RepID=A0A2J8AHM8_9CHLO|nr:KDEL motif-containing protein 1 [Tetrabaena socialis]|eukprot:PNH12007.1 KDEL motif-containing protein 1 [Tetrabaena socialis]